MAEDFNKDGKIYTFPTQPGQGHENLPSPEQRAWLSRGLRQPGGKLPLFDEEGQSYSQKTVRACISKGWAKPWFNNPIKPDWLVCKITDAGRTVLGAVPSEHRAMEIFQIEDRLIADETPHGENQ